MIAGPGGSGLAVARGPAGNTCCAAQGQDCTAAGCAGGTGALTYVGYGQGEYMQETTYRYVGYGGDFTRGRRDFTCIITSGCLVALLVLIPLLLWLLAGPATSEPFACNTGEYMGTWSEAQKEFCCRTTGLACPTEAPPTQPPTPPPTPPPTAPSPARPIVPIVVTTASPNLPPADPYNCAVGVYPSWPGAKQQWCCRNHNICSAVTQPARPADPYNCADGFANWQAGWSPAKKEWCCRVHGKGCDNGGGCAPGTSSAPYDCAAGYANWVAGWSQPKKQWCCTHAGKGCQSQGGGCA